MNNLQDWMKYLREDRKLVELCLPGSHDAGVYRDKLRGIKPGSKTCCQASDIHRQAMAGSRVFDIRCFLRTTGFFKREKTPTMGHFFKEGKDGYLGDYGGTLMSALDDAALFLGTHRTEFLIFRIGHTKCTGNVADALQQFRKRTDPVTYKMPNASLIHRGTKGNLADLEVKQLRGKLLLVFDKEFNSPNFSPDEGYYPYYKYDGAGTHQTGLTFCGKYSGGLGTALAPRSKNKGNWSADGAVKITHAACEAHQKHAGNHLLWVYWQETGGDVQKNTGAAQGMHTQLDQFLLTVKNQRLHSDPKTPYVIPNVIGHDFVSETTCGKIAKMNPDVMNKF